MRGGRTVVGRRYAPPQSGTARATSTGGTAPSEAAWVRARLPCHRVDRLAAEIASEVGPSARRTNGIRRGSRRGDRGNHAGAGGASEPRAPPVRAPGARLAAHDHADGRAQLPVRGRGRAGGDRPRGVGDPGPYRRLRGGTRASMIAAERVAPR